MKELEEYFANIFAIEGNKYLQNKIDHLGTSKIALMSKYN